MRIASTTSSLSSRVGATITRSTSWRLASAGSSSIVPERLLRRSGEVLTEGDPAHHGGVEARIDPELASDERDGRAITHDKDPLRRSRPSR